MTKKKTYPIKPPPPPAPTPKPPDKKKKVEIDPEIAKLRAEHQAAIKKYMKTRSSGDHLKRIKEKHLPSMNLDDRKELYDYLEKTPGMLAPLSQEDPPSAEGGSPVDPFLTVEPQDPE